MKQLDAIIRESSEEKAIEISSVKSSHMPVALETASYGSEYTAERAALSTLLSGEEEIKVLEEPIIQLTRKHLYDQVWELSVAELARKWGIPYASLMRQMRDAGIPIPPSGYWTQLRHGKHTVKAELPEPVDAIVSLFAAVEPKPKHIKLPVIQSEPDKLDDAPLEATSDKLISIDTSDGDVSDDQPVDEPETYTSYGGQIYNVYDRETLYKAVWAAPVTEVAKRYQVSDVAIHKVCKALDIPRPPRGYWAKVRAGKPVSIEPLPKTDGATRKTGLRTGTESRFEEDEGVLAFLTEEERGVVLGVAAQILIPEPNARFHRSITAHCKVVAEWEKQQRVRVAKGWNRLAARHAPALAETVSDQSLDRVFRIIDGLIKTMEPLGCVLAEDLRFVVNGETVSLAFSEFTDRIDHIPTKEENMKLLEYEEARRRNSWASKPQIRKYDYIFNGRLKVVINNKRHFRDCQSYVLEDRLGDIMIELYEAAEQVKKAREAREKEERRYQEEQRRKEEFRERHDVEVDRTLALTNMAEDYDIACKIRSLVSAIEASGRRGEEMSEWIEWAKAKADWYDPTVAREDEFLGKREHEKSSEDKKLRRKSYW